MTHSVSGFTNRANIFLGLCVATLVVCHDCWTNFSRLKQVNPYRSARSAFCSLLYILIVAFPCFQINAQPSESLLRAVPTCGVARQTGTVRCSVDRIPERDPPKPRVRGSVRRNRLRLLEYGQARAGAQCLSKGA